MYICIYIFFEFYLSDICFFLARSDHDRNTSMESIHRCCSFGWFGYLGNYAMIAEHDVNISNIELSSLARHFYSHSASLHAGV